MNMIMLFCAVCFIILIFSNCKSHFLPNFYQGVTRNCNFMRVENGMADLLEPPLSLSCVLVFSDPDKSDL